MSGTTEDDIDTMPEARLMSLPVSNAAPGDLSRLWSRHTAILQQRDLEELSLELAGVSGRRFMLFPDQDPSEKRKREEELARRALLAYEESMRDIRERSDRLLVQIEISQREIEKRRREIEENALRLRDARHVFVDGDHYRDEQGRVLKGTDADEARDRHREKPDASTWQERQEAKQSAEEMERLHEKVLAEQQRTETGGQGLGADELDRQRKEAQQRMTGYEKEFSDKVETERAGLVGKTRDDLAAAYSTDYGAAYGAVDAGRSTSYAKTQDGEGKTLALNFTPVAHGKTDPDTQVSTPPPGQGGPKAQA